MTRWIERCVVLTVLLALAAAPALGDVIAIPLPELTGDYQADSFTPPGSGDTHRTTTLTLPPEVTAIDQLRLVVSGTWVEGLMWCSGVQDPEPSPFQVGLSMFMTIPAAPGDYYYASVAPPDGGFAGLGEAFESAWPPGVLSFDQLLGTTIEIEFFVDWAILGICWLEDDSYGTITDVHLEITGTVPAEHTTWSEVKALYR